MSTVLVVAPVVIANWSAISAAVTAAVGAMGYAVAKEGRSATSRTAAVHSARAEIEVENSEIMGDASGADQEIAVRQDGVFARFSRDARGALKVCVEGEGYSKSQLRAIGEELVGRVTQQYAYHKLMTELRDREMTVVNEEVDADRTVRIRVKNW